MPVVTFLEASRCEGPQRLLSDTGAYAMFTVELPCPGTSSNFVVIKRDLDINTGGLNEVRNDGDCPLFVGALDSSDNVLSDVAVATGSFLGHFQPPNGAVTIYAVCHNECSSTAVLVYDDPDLAA